MSEIRELVARMVAAADHDRTSGLAADALREGAEVIEAQEQELTALREGLRFAICTINGQIDEVGDDGFCTLSKASDQLHALLQIKEHSRG